MSPKRSSSFALAALLATTPTLATTALATELNPASKTLGGGGLKPRTAVSLVRAKSARTVSFNPDARRLGIVGYARRSSPPPLLGKRGLPAPWEPSLSVYGGVADLATGNLALVRPITGWSALGPGVNLTLYANSAAISGGSADLGLGAGWRHSYAYTLTQTATVATLTRGDGREIAFARSGANYTVEAGYDERLTANTGGGWTVTYKDGSTLVFGATGLLTSQADASGNATTMGYTGGLLTSVTDAAGRALTLTYSGGRLISVTDPESRQWTFLYTGGRLTKVNDPSLDGQILGTGYGYDADGRITTTSDRLNRTWTYAYSPDGNFLTVTDPLNHVSGQSTSTVPVQDQNGFQTANAMTPTEPDANPTTYPTDTAAVVYVEDAGGNPAEYGMDASGRLTASRDGLGNQTNVQWDAKNDLTSRTDPAGKTTTSTYDARRNQTSTTDATGRSVTMTFSAGDDMTARTDASGTATFVYNARHQVTSTTDASGRTTSTAYNPNGTAASTTDGAGKVTTYGYDAAGNMNLVTDPLGHSTSYVYALDRVVSRTDARNRTTGYTYDAWKRLKAVDYPQSADQSFTYDAQSRMTAATDGTGTRTYTYDALGRKTDQTDPRGNTHATYDDASRLTSQTDVTGRLIQYGYDARGLMTGVSDSMSSVAYTYDTVGRLKTTTYSNGTVSTNGYDDAGRTTSLVHKQGPFTVIAGYTSTYDPAGRLSQVQETGGGGSATTSYSYDPANRLLTENRTGANPYASTYTYNSRGLRATGFRSENGVVSHDGTYTYDDAGRLTNVADAAPGSTLNGAYTWNDDGTLASYPGPGYTRNLSYDEEGRLTQISKGTVAAFQYAYGFDGGRRWRKDLAANVWDWYPCGVACCAGELVMLRSTDQGSSWSTVEAKLDRAKVLNGSPYLPSMGAGTQRIASEIAVTDGFRLARSGSYGPALSSTLLRYRGDLGMEQDLAAIGIISLKEPVMATCSKPVLETPQPIVALAVAAKAGPGLDCINACAATCSGLKGDAYVGCIAGCRTSCWVVIKKGCNALWNTCFKLPNNEQQKSCLSVYCAICLGE